MLKFGPFGSAMGWGVAAPPAQLLALVALRGGCLLTRLAEHATHCLAGTSRRRAPNHSHAVTSSADKRMDTRFSSVTSTAAIVLLSALHRRRTGYAFRPERWHSLTLIRSWTASGGIPRKGLAPRLEPRRAHQAAPRRSKPAECPGACAPSLVPR